MEGNCQGAYTVPVGIVVLGVWREVIAPRADVVSVVTVRLEAEHIVGSCWSTHAGCDGVVADMAWLVAANVCAFLVPCCRVSFGAPPVCEGCLAMVAYVAQAYLAS